MNYLLLQHPGHNRVYYETAGKLAKAELSIASQKLSSPCKAIEIKEIKNIRYLSIKVEAELNEKDIEILSRLSFVFAIFKSETYNNQELLLPIKKHKFEYIDDKISNILKYPGKTNELFTRMMINIALMSGDFQHSDSLSLLDPVAGKGTTLFEGLVYGLNVFGIETETKFVHDLTVFFKKYLERERIKHTANTRQVSGTKKSNATKITEFDFALTKEDFKAGTNMKKLGIVGGNTQYTADYYKPNSFHVIVGDLPYGISHSNASKNKSTISRNPAELLKECLLGWHQSLKKGGTVVVAWNTYISSKNKISEVFSANRFKVFSDDIYDNFEHMVDKSIKRDILVAKKE